MNCPTLISLLEFMRHRVSVDANSEINAHLSTGCPRCRENQQWLTDVIRLKSEDQSFDAPEELIQWLVAQFRVQSANYVPQPSKLRRLIANLVFDSLTTDRMVGVRSKLAGVENFGPRRLLYHAEGYDIDLRFEQSKSSGCEELVGQVLPEPETVAPSKEFTVRLLNGEQEIGISQTDVNGMFVFAQIQAGVFDLKIEANDGEIFISQINTSRIS